MPSYFDYENGTDWHVDKGLQNAFENAAINNDLSKLIAKTIYRKGRNADERIFEISLNRDDGATVMFQSYPEDLSKDLTQKPHIWTFRTMTSIPGQKPKEVKEKLESTEEGPKGFFERQFLPKVHEIVFAQRYPLSGAGYRAFDALDCKDSDLQVMQLG
jgi:hypothetical protein